MAKMTTTIVGRLTEILASIMALAMIQRNFVASAEELLRSTPVLSDGSSSAVVETVTTTKASAKNLTLYHINPLDYPADPVNMNLADLNGAVYFDLAMMFSIFWCTDNNPEVPHPKLCDNPEYDGKGQYQDIGVTKLIVEVTPIDGKLHGGYALCNICQNETSPVSPSHKCRNGEYVCDCFHGILFRRPKICTNPAVGRKRLYLIGNEHDDSLSREGYYDDVVPGYSMLPAATDPPPPSNDTEFFKSIYSQIRMVRRTHGFWYSTLEIGQGTTWRTVQVAKRITKECHASSFVRSVREHDRTHNNDRFAGCLRDDCDNAPPIYNHSLTNCWVQCFSDALLGPNSTQDKGYNGGGMNQQQLLQAWSRPFESEDLGMGGCPDVRSE